MSSNLTLFNRLFTEDGAIEIFAANPLIKIIYQGKHYSSYSQLPSKAARFIDRMMIEHPDKFAAVHKAGIRGAEVTDNILWCLFGGCDSAIDIDMSAGQVNVEYPTHCQQCKWEKPFCNRQLTPLTKTETNVAISIAHGYTDKEIANTSGSSEKTIHNHRNNIERKLQAISGRLQNSATITSFIIKSGV
jgi:hypothetical protein